MLEGIVTNPEVSVAELPILTSTEKHQLLVEWNDTQADYPRDKCIHQLFEEQAAKTPDAIAVVFGEEQLTYQELNNRANQLAHYLQKLGVRPEVLVGICVERSLEMVVGLLGILKAGGAYVPIDPAYPQERIAYMLEDSIASVLLTQERLVQDLPEHQAEVICLDTDWDKITDESQENFVSSLKPNNLAYVIYTSGSTGKPKGVMIEHRGFVNYVCWATKAYLVKEGSGAPVSSSLSFDATITSLYSPLLVGKKVVLLLEKNEIEELSACLCSPNNFSLIKITPAHLELLGQLLSSRKTEIQTRAFVVGGEALRGSNVSFWRTHTPQTTIINEYGPTETVVGCCIYRVNEQTSLEHEVAIGRPIANTKLYILDHNFQPVPIGVQGELFIGGDGVARGYLNQPELTEAKFIPNPLNNDSDCSSVQNWRLSPLSS